MDSYELSQWVAYYALQNKSSINAPEKPNTELSVEDEIALMKEALA